MLPMISDSNSREAGSRLTRKSFRRLPGKVKKRKQASDFTGNRELGYINIRSFSGQERLSLIQSMGRSQRRKKNLVVTDIATGATTVHLVK